MPINKSINWPIDATVSLYFGQTCRKQRRRWITDLSSSFIQLSCSINRLKFSGGDGSFLFHFFQFTFNLPKVLISGSFSVTLKPTCVINNLDLFVTLNSLSCALLPVGRGRRDGGGRLDLGWEERLHQPSLLQDVRCLRLHTGPGWSHRHGNRRAGLLCHVQGAEEATASGKRSRQAAHNSTLVKILYSKNELHTHTLVLFSPSHHYPSLLSWSTAVSLMALEEGRKNILKC